MATKRIWLIIIGILLILGSLTITVFAEPLFQTSSEDDVENAVPGNGPVDTVIGDDPDEDGFTGEIPTISDSMPPSEEDESTGGLPAWMLNNYEPQADDVDGSTQGGTRANSYFFTAGSTMHPRSSDTTWEYGGNGCVYAPSGRDWFILPIDIPDGSTILYLRIFYYDASAAASGSAYISRYDGSGGFADLLSVTSDEDSGYGTDLSTYSGHVVDTYNYSYVLLYRASNNDSTVRLCGLRINYDSP